MALQRHDPSVHGFGFNLLGTEASKRDVSIDIHMSDGSIYRETAEAHANETGGHQYYSYLVDPLLSGGTSIEGFVLYEDHQQSDGALDRDIFGVDDIALVVSDQVGTLNPSGFVDFMVDGPAFELEIGSKFGSLDMLFPM